MKILLVGPRDGDNSQNYRETMALLGKKTLLPPLGLLTVAAILPPEWQKKLVDLNVKELKDSDIKWADYVFLSGMHGHQASMKEVVKRSKRLGAKIVVGGPLISKIFGAEKSFYGDYKEFREIDHFVLDEAELTLPEFIHDLRRGNPKPAYRASKKADLGLSPVPLWNLIGLNDYFRMSIQFSRGCANECDFCDVSALSGNRYRVKSPGQAIKELTVLYEKGWRGQVFIVDDNFTMNKHLLKKKFLPELKKMMEGLDYPFKFSCAATVDLADDLELMQLMAETGFTTVFLGIESTNAESLRECNKKGNTGRDLLENVRKIHDAGLLIHGGFIIGFDHDTESTADEMFTFIQESGIVFTQVSVLCAPPETPLYERLRKEKRLYDRADICHIDGDTNFEPVMGYENVKKAYKKICSELLQPVNFRNRVLKCFEDHNQIKRRKLKLSLNEIIILSKLVIRLGFLDERSKIYRKVFLDLFSKYPGRLELIVSLLLLWHNSLGLFSRRPGFFYQFGL